MTSSQSTSVARLRQADVLELTSRTAFVLIVPNPEVESAAMSLRVSCLLIAIAALAGCAHGGETFVSGADSSASTDEDATVAVDAAMDSAAEPDAGAALDASAGPDADASAPPVRDAGPPPIPTRARRTSSASTHFRSCM